jgi:hypothetical protein
MGLGKTLISLITGLTLHRSPSYHATINGKIYSSGIYLVICPKATISEVWINQIRLYTGFGDSYYVYNGGTRTSREIELLKKMKQYKLSFDKDMNLKNKEHILCTSETLSGECSKVQKLNNIIRKRKKKPETEVKDSIIFRFNYT